MIPVSPRLRHPARPRSSSRRRARAGATLLALPVQGAALLALSVLGAALPAAAAAPVPSPEAYFGHPMGADRRLVSYDEVLPYYRLLADRSSRVQVESVGKTPEGREIVLVILSSPENLAAAGRYRRIAAGLDDPRGLSDAGVDSLVKEGKTILFVSLGIHSDEIGASQMGPEWAYRLATGDASSASRYLDDVIVVMTACSNPDGQVLVTDWYRKNAGTPYEGSDLPRLYNRYAGHDDNRDWYMLDLEETRALNTAVYSEWRPQILLDEHQMEMAGPRIFVPPYAEPFSPNVPPLVEWGANLVGAGMALALESHGKSGVIYGYAFDAYWPGGTRSTPWWKNTVGILTETASARVASPVFVDPGELTGGRKGLPEYRPRTNFPHPWPGGWWRLRDVVDYELLASDAALETAALHRRDFLANRAAMARDAVARGRSTAPYGYVFPPGQHDPGAANRLVDLLRDNGLQGYRIARAGSDGGRTVPEGSVLFPADQPYRPFLIEMMGRTEYPLERQGPGTDAVYAPYDVTAWRLPDLFGVDAFPLTRPPENLDPVPLDGVAWVRPPPAGEGDAWALSSAENASYSVAVALLQQGVPMRRAAAPFTAGGRRWPAGTFLARAQAAALKPAVQKWGAEAVAAAPPDSVPSVSLHLPRIGIYQSWIASMDEGWTRYLLDTAGFPYRTLHDSDLTGGGLDRRYDVIVLPDQSRAAMVEGRRSPRYQDEPPLPAPYMDGMGNAGVAALRRFAASGGTLVCLGRACELPLADFGLPVRDAAGGVPRTALSIPGTLLRVSVDPADPLGYGSPSEASVFVTGGPVLATRVPSPGGDRTVVARYVEAGRLVADGWMTGEDRLEGKAALVSCRMGAGRVVLFGFRPQYRGQTVGTFRLLFNALLAASGEPPVSPGPAGP